MRRSSAAAGAASPRRWFGPAPYQLKHLPHPGAFALGQTGGELRASQAISRAGIRAGSAVCEKRPAVKIPEKRRTDRQRGAAAAVVEEEKARLEVFEIDLIADQVEFGVFQKSGAVRPGFRTQRAYFKGSHTASSSSFLPGSPAETPTARSVHRHFIFRQPQNQVLPRGARGIPGRGTVSARDSVTGALSEQPRTPQIGLAKRCGSAYVGPSRSNKKGRCDGGRQR